MFPSVWFTLLVVPAAAGTCRVVTLDFILLRGDALMPRIEGYIRADAAQIGITANTRPPRLVSPPGAIEQLVLQCFAQVL